MYKSNYDKYPATPMEGIVWKGWENICNQLKSSLSAESCVLVIECYQGVLHDELRNGFAGLHADCWIDTQSLFKPVNEIEQMTYPYVTDDRLFGFRTHLSYKDFFNTDKLASAREKIRSAQGLTVVYGHGAAWVAPEADCIVYVDMARWEIQMRSRRHEINGLGVENKAEGASYHYKRGYFVDWVVCDQLKKQLLSKADYWMDTHIAGEPKMITGDLLRKGLDKTAHQPFRVVPFFDPAPWGGQWMKRVCDLNPDQPNYGWCFDCVPEENSLYFNITLIPQHYYKIFFLST